MMHQPSIGDLSRAFRTSTGAVAHQRFLLRQQEKERERRERNEDARNDDAELMDFAMVMVSAAEIDAFRLDLDQYDAATVGALQENERELIEVRERMDHLLGQAHTLPDGRRVFKTEDGLRVFDELGAEVDASTIDSDLIDDFRPRWETYKPELDRLSVLMEQRAELLAYQQKLDEARDRLDRGDLTREEFDALRDDMKVAMPDAVRSHIPELADSQEPTPEAETLDFTDEARPTVFTANVHAPGMPG